MTGTEIALIISASGTLLSAMAGVVSTMVALGNRREISASRADIQDNAANVKKIEVATNSMKDALVQATRVAAHAQGLAEGKAAEQANPSGGA